MEEVEGVGNLTEIRPDHMWGEAIWVSFYKLEEIRRRSRFHIDRGNAWHYKVIVVDVFKKVEQWAYIGVPFDLRTLDPIVVRVFGSRFQKSSGVPWPTSWKSVRGRRDGGHYEDFYGYRAVLWMSLPAVGQDTRFDYLFYDYGRLWSSGPGLNFSRWTFNEKRRLLRKCRQAPSP